MWVDVAASVLTFLGGSLATTLVFVQRRHETRMDTTTKLINDLQEETSRLRLADMTREKDNAELRNLVTRLWNGVWLLTMQLRQLGVAPMWTPDPRINIKDEDGPVP